MCGYHLGREELGKIVRREYIQQELNPAIQLLLTAEWKHICVLKT
jgi:hypothetical protein